MDNAMLKVELNTGADSQHLTWYYSISYEELVSKASDYAHFKA